MGRFVFLLPAFLFWLQAPSGCHGHQAGSSSPDVSYAILIDAGSTGSRMYIFKFNLNGNGKVNSVENVEELSNSLGKVRPGLSSMLNKADEIEAHFQKFFDEADKIVPKDKQSSTPFVVLATAGMRLLPESDQDAIINEVKQILKSDQSPFLFKDQNVEVISGKDEAIFAWITVNFIQGVLTSPRRQRFSWGVLDLGGASTQNTMRLFRKSRHSTTLKLGKKNYNLFARSYLDMGLARIHDRYLEFLNDWENKTVDEEGSIKSPCHHQGFSETFDVSNAGQAASVIGEPNSEVCRKLIDDVLSCKNRKSEDCPFHDQPQLTGKFIAFSAFHTVINRIEAIICDDKPVTVEQIGCAAKKFCSKPYNVVKVIDEGYGKFSCLWGNYVYELFQKGYKMPQSKKIYVQKKLKGYSLSWIMGAVLYKTELL
ncbi:hypothetical protein ACROYT_G034032 [Oculina patagonica]